MSHPGPPDRPPAAGESRFGSLRAIPASSPRGFTHEAHDFTPWLAGNLELLGEELGLLLQLKEREYAVGRYSLDLLLEDAQGRTVIVENQFGQTDHDHLGKLLTYCAGTEADVVIWIAETLTEEHVAALEWLNESTVAGVGFFGVELELLEIDDSRPAPHFRVAVKPNEWVKRVRPEPGPAVEWGWAAYAEELGISQERIRIGRELCEQLERAIRDRGLPWTPFFRKGYVAFQRGGSRNIIVVDLWWRKVPRLAVKLPKSPAELGLLDPYPELESSWDEDEREWGWTIATMDALPDVAKAIDVVRPFHRDGAR